MTPKCCGTEMTWDGPNNKYKCNSCGRVVAGGVSKCSLKYQSLYAPCVQNLFLLYLLCGAFVFPAPTN